MLAVKDIVRTVTLAVILTLAWNPVPDAQAQDGTETPKYVMVLHGGAGTITRENMTDRQEKRYRAKLREALQTGYEVLEAGQPSLDAVVEAIQVLEASPLFNAGKGAVFTNQKTVELDASIMNGEDRQAGAVTGVQRAKSPIQLARLVMEESPHVMLAFDGADTFAEQQGMEMVPNDYFYTDRRLRQIEQRLEEEETGGGDGAALPRGNKMGTVGAVALDQDGNLAAGTSTGGMTNKRWGRVGDSPIIGAGTYADNQSCGVSSTGWGEFFIRGVLAHDIAAMKQYGGLPLKGAARAVIMDKLDNMGGTGGVIALDREGNIAMPFNTEGMYRGYVDQEGNITVKIYKDE